MFGKFMFVSFLCVPLTSFSNAIDESEIIEYVITQKLKYNPRHLLRKSKNAEVLARYADAILAASRKSGVPWEEIVTTSYCESTFRIKAKGKVGEIGLMQLNNRAPWQHCSEIEGRKISRRSSRKSVEDQYLCGSYWLAKYKAECDGTFKKGIAKYMSGYTCKPKKGTKFYRIIKYRMGVLKEIEGLRDSYIANKGK